MNEDSHITHLLILCLGILLSLFFFAYFRYNHIYQFYSVIVGVVYYIAWGFIHHLLEDRLSFPIIMEYVLIGGIVILLFALVLYA